ncbi:hypothetical protein MRA01_17670 [Methylobacterium radiotolerans]|nr:hypothetical protein MRA01_17670 [Methylobacterium radiotolerans]
MQPDLRREADQGEADEEGSGGEQLLHGRLPTPARSSLSARPRKGVEARVAPFQPAAPNFARLA